MFKTGHQLWAAPGAENHFLTENKRNKLSSSHKFITKQIGLKTEIYNIALCFRQLAQHFEQGTANGLM